MLQNAIFLSIAIFALVLQTIRTKKKRDFWFYFGNHMSINRHGANKKEQPFVDCSRGLDGTRTRDLLRDRQAF